MMYLMLEIPPRVAMVAAFPSQGYALVPLAKLLERMDVLERERVSSLLIPAMGGNVRVFRYPDVLRGSLVSVDIDDDIYALPPVPGEGYHDDIYALPPVPGEGYLRATPEMLQGDEALRLEAILMAFRAQLRELKAEGQAA